jgi:DNA polymerase I-like protein with 3'-5' exonuclease and polymerase domains
MGTYIAQMSREICNGKINPFFDLHVPVSYRSSSSAPNWQNMPKRDKDSELYIRGGIFPTKGNKILAGDYSGVEVKVSACTHKDKNMIKYVCDTSTDMHRDTSSDLFKLTHKEVTDKLRFYAKNQWVFAQFYGDYYGNCAKNIWKTCLDLVLDSGITVRNHLKSVGINIMINSNRIVNE